MIEQETTEQESTPFESLSEEARTAIEQLVSGILKEDQTARRAEVRRAWDQRAMDNGIAHTWYDNSSYCLMLPQASGEELPPYMDNYNVYTPHRRNFTAILSENPPGLNFPPDDLQKGIDVTASDYAEKMRHRVDRLVHMKDAQMDAAKLFCTDGRTIAWTKVYGGNLCVEVNGVLEWKAPAYVDDMAEWDYAVRSVEQSKWKLKDEFPDFADDIDSTDDSSSEADYERYARLMILGNRRGFSAGDAFKSVATRHDAWIRPWRYRKIAEGKKGEADGIREEVEIAFPDGLRATVISGKLVDCVPETMESCLSVAWPVPGDGQIRPSLLHDIVEPQRAFNDLMNMVREFSEFCLPALWIADGAVDSEALPEQVSAPGVVHVLTVPTGASVEDLVFREPTPDIPQQVIDHIDRILKFVEFTSGDLPSLYGDGTQDAGDTYGEAKLLSSQAKGQLSAAWAAMQWLFAGVYSIAIKLAAQMSPGSLAVEGSSGNDSIDPQAILEGKWGCYPDTDSSFPESTADKRAAFQTLMSQVGQVDPSIPLQPDNLKLAKQLTGLADVIIPGAQARDKQLEEIDQLLQEGPVPNVSDPQWQQAAQQAIATQTEPPDPPLISSVPIGRYDFDQPEFDKCKEWLSSPACREELRKGNFKGVQNVELHASLHEQRIQQKAQAAAPKPEPPKVSLTAKVDDPNAVSQLLGEVGVNAPADEISANNLPEQQNRAADTQLKAATAQHKSVLAAKEAVAPVKSPNAVPDVAPKEK